MSGERLYSLLPAIYRQLDSAQGEPLRALMLVLESQYDQLRSDIEATYRDWFIETCAPEAVQNIASLLGPSASPAARALVGNLIRLRRRKGIATNLQPLTWAATGWYARAEEAWPFRAVTANLSLPGTLNVKNADLNGLAHRNGSYPRIDGAAGIVLDVYRLMTFPVTLPATFSSSDGVSDLYFIHPLSVDVPCFNQPTEPLPPDRSATPVELPVPITRKMLRDALALAAKSGSGLYGAGKSLNIVINGKPVPASSIDVTDLTHWNRPVSSNIAFDPELGRIAVASGAASTLSVSFSYALGASIGGGPYPRTPAAAERMTVLTVGAKGAYKDLGNALAAWIALGSPRTVIRILDSGHYAASLATMPLPPNGALRIESIPQAWPTVTLPSNFTLQSPADGRALFSVGGLALVGTIMVAGTGKLEIRISDVTSGAALLQQTDTGPIILSLERSMIGSIDAASAPAHITAKDSMTVPNSR